MLDSQRFKKPMIKVREKKVELNDQRKVVGLKLKKSNCITIKLHKRVKHIIEHESHGYIRGKLSYMKLQPIHFLLIN